MNKRMILMVKVVVLVAVLAGMGWAIYSAWKRLGEKAVDLRAIEWRYGAVAIAGFAGLMLTSGAMWLWLARKMGNQQSPSQMIRLLGAYTFSQMGKYLPGKVVLLLMRIERAARFGMKASVCTMSTLLENALYMISGALVGIVAIARLTGELAPAQRGLAWPVTIAVVVGLMAACHPRVFYGLMNGAMRKFKQPEIPRERQLGMGTLVMAVIGFLPCWIFGGLALWGTASCLRSVGLAENWWFAGAFSLSVIIGMASFLPGGLGIREAVLAAALTLAFTASGVEHDKALVLAGAGAVLQRVFQIVAEIGLGVAGGVLSGRDVRQRGESNQAKLAQESRR